MADRVEVTCPCCSTQLTVDTDSGEILAEHRPGPDHDKSFESAMSDVQSGANRRSAAFDKAFDRNSKMEDLLDKKFEEARKKAETDPAKKPHNPFEFD